MPGPNTWLSCYWVCNNFMDTHFDELGISGIPRTAGWEMMVRSLSKTRIVGCLTILPVFKRLLWLYLSTHLSFYRYLVYIYGEIKCLFFSCFICCAVTVLTGFLHVILWMKMYLCRWLLTGLLSESGWQDNVGCCDTVCSTFKVLEGWA